MYTAVIVEPRKHAALSFVMRNALENLSDEWNVMLFHGSINGEFVKDIVNSELQEYKTRISFINMNVENLTQHQYSNLLKTADFYDPIPTETFLIFQTDSMIFPKNKDLIHKFMKYDYVGAPWNHEPRRNGHCVGNGGFSLRKKSKMLEIIEKNPPSCEPEDVFFGCQCIVPLYTPSREEASEFSIEAIFHENSFATHQPWILKDQMLACYPEVETLMQLNQR